MQKITKWFAMWLSVFTFVMAPVAQGEEAQKISKTQLEYALKEMGLNQQITVGEFYKKNKDLFPERIQKEIEPYLMSVKNQMMPEIEVVTTKGSKGLEIPTLRFSKNSELINLQWFGEKDKFLKFQNTNLTEVDLFNFNDMFTRIIAGDEKYRKQFEAATRPVSVNTNSGGYPEIPVATWKKMSQKERAAYIVNLRLLWNDARKVLAEVDKRKNSKRKTSMNENLLQKWDTFLALINTPVEAVGSAGGYAPKGTQPKAPVNPGGGGAVQRGAGSSAYASGSNCLVAGYISKYNNNKCDVENIKNSYPDDALVKAANESCQKGQVACNPYVYGTPQGVAICVATNQASFQIATHFEGPCDQASPLGSKQDFLINDQKKQGRYEAENLTKLDLAKKYADEQAANPELVKNFLDGLTLFNKNKALDFKEPLSANSFEAIVNLKNSFNDEIRKAKESCEAATSNKNNEPNFWGACDQLHRRYLNVAQFLSTTPGCKNNGKINSETLLCSCPSSTVSVMPGHSCSESSAVIAAGGTVSGDPSTAPGGKINCEEKYGIVSGLNAQCLCADGSAPTEDVADSTGGAGSGAKSFKCKAVAAAGTATAECGWLCKAGKFAKSYLLPAAIAGAVAYGVWKIFLEPKKPKLKSAKDFCPDGSIPSPNCKPLCPAPYTMQSNGSCNGCGACPVGQSTSVAAGCVCSSTTSTGETNGATLTCPDNVTVVDNLSKCPYQCWDGTFAAQSINCPVQPAASKAQPGKVSK